jgi:hypothetical protein
MSKIIRTFVLKLKLIIMESQCAMHERMNEEEEKSKPVFEYNKSEQQYKDIPPHLDTVNLCQPTGVNLEKESRIPTEEDTAQENYNNIESLFMGLHHNEQNEVIIKVLVNRHREIEFLRKQLDYKINLYFNTIIDGI